MLKRRRRDKVSEASPSVSLVIASMLHKAGNLRAFLLLNKAQSIKKLLSSPRLKLSSDLELSLGIRMAAVSRA